MLDDPHVRFRDLYARTCDAVLRFTKRRVDPSRAEDVVAEVYLVAWRRFADAPRGQRLQLAWLFAIARRCLLNTYRSDGRRDALAVRVAGLAEVDRPVVGDHAGAVQERLDLARAWRGLSAADQEVLALTAFDDLTSVEAARVLGVTPAAYRVRLARARRRLRDRLETADHPAPTLVARPKETTP